MLTIWTLKSGIDSIGLRFFNKVLKNYNGEKTMKAQVLHKYDPEMKEKVWVTGEEMPDPKI